MTASGIVAALARYTRSFHQVAGDGHHVASPLGAWLLLALAGPQTAGLSGPLMKKHKALACRLRDRQDLVAGLAGAAPGRIAPTA